MAQTAVDRDHAHPRLHLEVLIVFSTRCVKPGPASGVKCLGAGKENKSRRVPTGVEEIPLKMDAAAPEPFPRSGASKDWVFTPPSGFIVLN